MNECCEFSRNYIFRNSSNKFNRITIEANDKEMQALAQRLAIPNINQLKCSFQFKRLNEENIYAKGSLNASLIQNCVVTLEELVEEINEQFELMFVPKQKLSHELEDIDDPDLIPYENNCIDLGAITAEQLALCINPYPHKLKKPDEVFPLSDDGKSRSLNNPFAILSKLYDKN